MSDEPTYIYVKGEGWVPMSDQTYLLVDIRGGKWLVCERDPKPGEKWTATNDEYKSIHDVLQEWPYEKNVFTNAVDPWNAGLQRFYKRYFVFLPYGR